MLASRGLFGIRRAVWAVAALLLCSMIGNWPPAARADEKITYLFPAPPILPAFGPIQIAKGKGYFSQAGLDVNYAVGRGGVDVAKEVGAGNVPIGGIVAGLLVQPSPNLNWALAMLGGVAAAVQPAVDKEQRHDQQPGGNCGLGLVLGPQLHDVAPVCKYVSSLSCSRTLPCCSPSVTPSITTNSVSRSSALMNFTSCR